MASRLLTSSLHLRRALRSSWSIGSRHTAGGVAAAITNNNNLRQSLSTVHPTAGKPKGTVPGFSFPGPKSLDKIVKVQLLQKHGTPRVREIWDEYHRNHKTAVGDSITAEEHNIFMQRTKRCPLFVLPVPRDGGYFTLLIQFQDKYCLCTYLEDFKKNPAAAMPYIAFSVFEDMLQKKSVALIRGEVSNHMTVPEAKKIWELIKRYYLGGRHHYDDVIAFNEKSEDFEFQKVLNVAQVSC